MNIDEQRRAIVEAIAGCERLVAQIEGSAAALAEHAPFSADAIDGFPAETWDALYAFQMKFLLLQDLASRRLVRGLLAFSGEDPRGFSFRQAIDRVADLGAIESSDAWMELTTVRNMLAHDYPVDLAQFASRLVEAWDRREALVRNVRRLIATIRSGDQI